MKLTDKIHLLRIDFEIHISSNKKIPRFVNVLLIFGDRITLIDSGIKGCEKKIFDYIESQGRKVDEIGTIILSHAHPDHIGSASKIKEITNCKVLAHPLEKTWIEDIELQYKQRPVPGFFNLVDTAVKVDDFIEDKEVIQLQKNLTLHFTKSPGHSIASLNILFLEDKIFFTADSIPLKNDFPIYDNYIELMESLEKIKQNKSYEILLTSWTPPIIDKQAIDDLFKDGEEYMKHVDFVVQECYQYNESEALENCKKAISKLGLPLFLATPLVDKAFKSHL